MPKSIMKALWIALTMSGVLACQSSSDGDPPLELSSFGDNSCEFALNDRCDEPTLCALGTDDFDCFSECEQGDGERYALISGACDYRDGAFVEYDSPVLVRRSGKWQESGLYAMDDEGRMVYRHFRIYQPAHLKPTLTYPIVLMLPGNRVSHYSLAQYTQLEQSAEANSFILVDVEQPWRSRTFSWSWYTDWNWAEDAANNPDLKFLETLVAHLLANYPGAPSDVFVAGHSRGAAMSIIAALELPHLFAGAIPQSGFVEFGYYDRLLAMSVPENKPKFYFMHGALDDDVCIDCEPGGRCGVTPGRRCGGVASSDALVETLREKGWGSDVLRYARLENVAHRWQPWLNHIWWDFMRSNEPNESPGVGFWQGYESGQVGVHAPLFDLEEMVGFSSENVSVGTDADKTVGRYGDGWFVNEQPTHEVALNSFYLDRTEVTVGQFGLFIQYACGARCLDPRMPFDIEDGSLVVDSESVRTPIRFVTHDQAQKYCTWMGKRLPTEAEFEHAFRGADERAWPWTQAGGPKCAFANFLFEGGRCADGPYEVAHFETNQTPNGVYDLAGNVSEWMADEYASYPGSNLDVGTGDSFGVVRGGSYLSARVSQQSRARLPVSKSLKAPDVGFRCAWDLSMDFDPGILRGSLPPLGEIDSPALDESPDSFWDGLDDAGAVFVDDEQVWLSTSEGVWSGTNTDSKMLIAEQTVDSWHPSMGSLWGLNVVRSTLCEFDNEALLACFQLDDVVSVAWSGMRLYWTNGSQIFERLIDSETDELVVEPSGVITELAGSSNGIYWLERRPDGMAFMSAIDDELVEYVGPEQISNPLGLSSLRVNDDRTAHLFIGFGDQWPHSALLCRVNMNNSQLGCLTHTPPKSTKILEVDGELFWAHQFGVSSLRQNSPYEMVRNNVSPSGFFVDSQSVWVSDKMRGRLWQWVRTP